MLTNADVAAELDAERQITQNLSLTLDQKNRKIQELTQALKAEQVVRKKKKHAITPTKLNLLPSHWP